MILIILNGNPGDDMLGNTNYKSIRKMSAKKAPKTHGLHAF